MSINDVVENSVTIKSGVEGRRFQTGLLKSEKSLERQLKFSEDKKV